VSVDVRAVGAPTRRSTQQRHAGAPAPSRCFTWQLARGESGGVASAQRELFAVAFVDPYADVRPSALPVPYAPPAPPSNTLAVLAPVTRPTRRAAPRAELAAALETAALHGLGGSAAAVLTALLSWANASGVAWPCAESIARRSCKSRRTVFYALAQLEEAGLVVRRRPSLRARRRFRESNTYQLAPLVAVPSPSTPRSPRRVAEPRAVTGHTRAVTPPVTPVTRSPESSPSPALAEHASPSTPRSPPMRFTAEPRVRTTGANHGCELAGSQVRTHPSAPPSPSPFTVAPRQPPMGATPAAPVEPSEATPAEPPRPSPSPTLAEPAPAATGPASGPVQVQPLHGNEPGENQNQNARTGAQARATTAPPGDRLGSPAATRPSPEATHAPVEPRSPAAAPSAPEATYEPRRTRAERAAANRAAWAARPRSSPSATRVPPPRRSPAPRAPGYQAPPPDPAAALAALREWRSTLPALGSGPEPASAPLAPVLDVPRSELGREHPLALGGLLAAFARGQGHGHAGPHERSPRTGAGAASATRSQSIGAAAPSGPRVEARPPPLWSPHPRR